MEYVALIMTAISYIVAFGTVNLLYNQFLKTRNNGKVQTKRRETVKPQARTKKKLIQENFVETRRN